MKKKVLILFLALMGAPLFAGPLFNVAFNKDVVLEPEGSFFVGGWDDRTPPGAVSEPGVIVDGVFLPENYRWDQSGSVWWDQTPAYDQDQAIYIDLGKTVQIEKLIAQVDNNDGYIISYWNQDLDAWETAWYIDKTNFGDNRDWGLLTRPVPYNQSQMHVLDSPIVTNALRIQGDVNNSDQLFAVSEIQAFGVVVPAPGSLMMAFLGISLAGYLKHRKQN